MKFAYSLIKKLAPGKYDEKTLAEKLNLLSFETADLGGGVLDAAIAPNRFSDAASHLGIAREVSVIFGCKLNDPTLKIVKKDSSGVGPFSVKILDKNLCGRYMAAYVTDVKVGPSPKWLVDILETCGLRSINNIVDIMNYVMLEIGQPLHAFDADKVQKGIVVRIAKPKEKIETIDSGKYAPDKSVLMIADHKQPLAIAGIKGGKFSEVSSKTKRILIEAANFNGVNIYKSSRKLALQTDASIRFSHGLSPALAELGMNRALTLLKELAGAKIYKTIDVYPRKQSKKMVKIDLKKINKIIGYEFKPDQINKILQKLDFNPPTGKDKNFWLVPPLRLDINDIEDVAEEIARFHDYNKLPSRPPTIAMGVADEGEEMLLKDRVRRFLRGAGLSEVYNYSFSSSGELTTSKAIALLNPVSNQFAYLRDSLVPGLIRNLKDNLRFSDEVRIFEIGKVFESGKNKAQESLVMGIAIVSKKGLFEVKGLIDALFGQLGLTDYFTPDFKQDSKIIRPSEALRICHPGGDQPLAETGDHQVLGYLGSLSGVKNGAVVEIDLEKLLKATIGEKEFEPLPKYPSIIRDLSLLVSKSVRVGELMALFQNISPKLIRDVDLVDFYEDSKLGANRKSLTFRVVFQADDRTLTDQEVDKEIAIIHKVLADRFDVEIR